jgi:hypothetical protein
MCKWSIQNKEMKDKPINTFNGLRDFCIATIGAIGEVSIKEAQAAIIKAFEEYKNTCETEDYWDIPWGEEDK